MNNLPISTLRKNRHRYYIASDIDFSPLYNSKLEKVGVRYIGVANYVIIPEVIHGKKLYDISYMFSGNENIISVILPKTAIIAVATFKDCINLRYISFNNSLIEDMSEICYGCVSLERISLLPKNTITMNRAFYNCYSLQFLPRLPLHLKYANEMCYNCELLIKVFGDFPYTLEEADHCFFHCISLEHIPVIPRSLWLLDSMLEECYNFKGPLVVNSYFPSCNNFLKNAGKNNNIIKLDGDSSKLFSLAATNPLQNVMVSSDKFLYRGVTTNQIIKDNIIHLCNLLWEKKQKILHYFRGLV